MSLTPILLLASLVLLVFLAGRGNLFGSSRRGVGAEGLTRFLVTLFRLALFVAIAASAALVVDYQSAGDPAFCGVSAGCAAVRASPYSRFLGVPLPSLGLSAYAVLLAASLVARAPRHHDALAVASVAGGVAATILLGIQAFVVGELCAWCTAVDVAAIVGAAVAVLIAWLVRRSSPSAGARPDPDADERGALQGDPKTTLAWAMATVAAIGLPFVWGMYPIVPPLPPDIAALEAPGKVTIVGFTDFQCPYCRRLHPDIEALEAAHGERIQYVRKMMPLAGHPGALPAAKAYVCAPEAKREQAATLLYGAPAEMLTDAAVVELLEPLALDRAAFSACLGAPATRSAIESDMAIFNRIGVRGLPLTYVGRRLVVGYNPDRIQEMLRREIDGEQTSLPLPGLFVALAGVAAVAVSVNARAKPRPASHDGASSSPT